MPALIACFRIWEFGTDDLFFPTLASVIIRVVWFFGLLGGVLYFRGALVCEPMHYILGFCSALLFITLMSIIIESAIGVLSTRGSIVHITPRRHIKYLLYMRILVLAFEVALLIIGTAFSFKSQEESDRLECPELDTAVTMLRIVLAGYWLVFIVLVVVVVVYLDPCHCYSAKVNYSQVTTRIQEGNIDQEFAETHWKLVHTVWEKRFKVACCVAGSDDVHQLAYRDVAEIFAHLFCDTNVVMSDIVAGLVLLQKEHLAEGRALRDERPGSRSAGRSPEDETDFAFDFHHEADRELFRDAFHYVKYALGMYSWPIFVYMNPFCGLCRLYKHLNCCGERNEQAHIHKDNRCSCYLGGLRQLTGINELDIIYVSFENDVYMVPYMVCLDHDSKSVVVGFRGTLSFGDIVTDLTASTKPMELPDFPNFLVHKGMLKTVSAILKNLDEEQILESAFEKAPGYKLVLVGHSLGSGCACIMSILLREKYPDLRCFCYSPTGSLLNEAAAIFTEDFVTSVTLGEDLVARLNVPNTHKLKDDLVRVIESCHKPKCRILLEGCMETICTCFGGSVVFHDPENINQPDSGRNFEENTETSNDEGEAYDSNESNPLLVSISIDPEESLAISSLRGAPTPQNGNSSPRSARNAETMPIVNRKLSSLKLPVRGPGRHSGDGSPTSSLNLKQEVARRLIPLFPPGRIIHIVDRSENKPCFCGSRRFEVQWSNRGNFDKILVSPDMIRDHFPDVLQRAMSKIWNRKQMDLEDSELRRRHQ